MQRSTLTIVLQLFVALVLFLAGSTGARAQGQWTAEGPPVRITPEGQTFIQPIFSPSGNDLAVTGPRYRGIYLIDRDAGVGQNIRTLTDAPGAGYRFAWSPDGRAIVTRVARYQNGRRFNAVKLYDVASGKAYALTPERSFMPVLPEWSADGSRVFLPMPEGVEMLSLPAGIKVGKAPLTAQERRPAAVTLVRDEFRAIDAGGREVARFRPVAGRYLNAVRSPDGSKIAFEVLGGKLYVVNVDGSGLVDLGQGERPRWAPDSEWLVYMVTRDDGHRLLGSDIYVIRIDGSGRTNLTDSEDRLEMNPSWSADGTTIAYDDHLDGGIYLLHVRQP